MASSSYLFQDWVANRGNPKGRMVMLFFRIASWFATGPRWRFILGVPYLILYRLGIEWVLGIELPMRTRVGRGLRIYHGVGLVVNDGTVIGEDCVLRHATTLGHKREADANTACPVLHNGVNVGSNSVVLGPITIGAGAVIAAGSVVIHSVPAGATVAGNPARVVATATTAGNLGSTERPETPDPASP